MSFRIAILGTRGIPNHYGGFEQLAEHLAPGLVKAGHTVTVYNSHNHPYQGKEWEGVEIRHCYDAEKLAVSFSDFYIADSPVIQSYFRNKYGIESEYIAYGAELFQQADERVPKEYGVSPGNYFLLMARMEPENNIETILDGFIQSH